MVKNLLLIQETWVQSLGWEDPLEDEMTTHSSILAWRIPWTEKPGMNALAITALLCKTENMSKEKETQMIKPKY